MIGNSIRIFDGHCDVLYKMWEDPTISFKNSQHLHVNLNYLEHYHKNIQCFALYIPEKVKFENRFTVCLEMIDIFYNKVLAVSSNMKLVTSQQDIKELKNNEIGAILTLEGCDAIGSDHSKLAILFQLGVTSIGLTWNYANLVADGVLETRGAGLTNFGREVVHEINRAKAWTDVSHLCERSFWDVMELADYPIASHSNAFSIFSHPRNLKDNQIQALIKKNGVIGITFVPKFLAEKEADASIDLLIKHIDHICSLGGEKHIGFGSDFDGIETVIHELPNYYFYGRLIEELLQRFPEELVRGFCFENFVSRFPK